MPFSVPGDNPAASGLGLVRLLIPDLVEDEYLLTDAQLEALYTINGDVERLAAADALEIIASSEALVSKKIRTQDLQTDGPAVSKELRERAKLLRAQVAATVATTAGDDDTVFEVGDFHYGTTAEELAPVEL